MAIVLALLSALTYGVSDFLAGVAARRWAAEPVAGVIVLVELVGAGVATLVVSGAGPRGGALGWGALSGVGGALGTLALYRGLARGAMTVVAAVSAVLAAVVPVLVGIALGTHLGPAAAVGIVLGIPAIALVCLSPGGGGGPARGGLGHGLIAGAGFGLLFVGLARAGTGSGAWPVLAGQAVSLVLIGPVALRTAIRRSRPARRDGLLAGLAGLLAAAAALLFLAASGRGSLPVVAVLSALYPAWTVLLARWLLSERWSRVQAAGLGLAVLAVVLVSLG